MQKKFFPIRKGRFIIDWLRQFYDKETEHIGYLRMLGTDMQHNNDIFFASQLSPNDIKYHLYTFITKNNLLEMSIYLTIRHIIETNWVNDRDNFLYPENDYIDDTEFQNNCFVYALFSNFNNNQSAHGINHWIPFTEKEVNARNKFKSNFMSGYLKGKELSNEAQELMQAGKELWKYYHSSIKDNKTASVDASFYDIREFFQGRSEKGTMKTKSNDETYNTLIKTLREKLKKLGMKIEPKVYKYGFLKR